MALPELDPGANFGVGGAWRAYDAAGGSWLRAAAALATRVVCTSCHRVCTALCVCGAHAAAAAAAGPRTRARASLARLRLRCGDDICDGRPAHADQCTCELHVLNSFLFAASAKVVHGDGSAASGLALLRAIDATPTWGTLRLSGSFVLSDDIFLTRSIALIGEEEDRPIISGERMVYVTAEMTCMRSMTFVLGIPKEDEEVAAIVFPPVQVEDMSTLHAVDLDIRGVNGTAFMLADGGSAMLERCRLVSDYLGLVAKSHSTISMYNNTVGPALWGLFAGPDGGNLAASNTFRHIACEKITQQYNEDYEHISVQPWRVWKERPMMLRPPPLPPAAEAPPPPR